MEKIFEFFIDKRLAPHYHDFVKKTTEGGDCRHGEKIGSQQCIRKGKW